MLWIGEFRGHSRNEIARGALKEMASRRFSIRDVSLP